MSRTPGLVNPYSEQRNRVCSESHAGLQRTVKLIWEGNVHRIIKTVLSLQAAVENGVGVGVVNMESQRVPRVIQAGRPGQWL